jgi:hypothetical protein
MQLGVLAAPLLPFFYGEFSVMARLELNQIQIISGTGIMVNMNHARQIEFSMPRFASRPDITISIYSDDNMPPKIASNKNANPGTMFAPWAIEYLPGGGVGGQDRIVVSAANTQTGVSTPVRVMCSYIAMGTIAKTK